MQQKLPGYLSAAHFGHRMAAASAIEIKGTRVASDAPSHGTRQQRYEKNHSREMHHVYEMQNV
jgi:hypothetical protein